MKRAFLLITVTMMSLSSTLAMAGPEENNPAVMRSRGAASSFLVGTGSQPTEARQPNLIACQDDSGVVELDYAAESLTGEPRFSLVIHGEQVFPPTSSIGDTGGLIRLDTGSTIFGTFVQATDATSTPVDAPAKVYGFFVPSVSVEPGGLVEFTSVLLTGLSGGFIPPNVPAERVEQAIEIQCEATWIVF